MRTKRIGVSRTNDTGTNTMKGTVERERQIWTKTIDQHGRSSIETVDREGPNRTTDYDDNQTGK